MGTNTPFTIANPIDVWDHALIIIDTVHHEVHEGHSYSFHAEHLTPASGVSNYIHIKTAAKYPHLFFDFQVTGGNTRIQMYEGATVATTGTVISFSNYNRNSSNVPVTTAFLDTTITTVGTVLFSNKVLFAASSTQSKANTATREGTERVWKANTDYVIKITPLAASTSWTCDGYMEEASIP